MKKKILYWIQKYDAIWSVPLGFLAFFLVGFALTGLFGWGTGSYDVAFIVPLFLATTVVVGATNAAVAGLRFTLRGFHDYLYGKKVDGEVVKPAKADWKELSPIQRFTLVLCSLAFFIISILVVYLNFF